MQAGANTAVLPALVVVVVIIHVIKKRRTMTETYSGREQEMDAEHFSEERFKQLAELARKAEQERVAAEVKDGEVTLYFSVASWLTGGAGMLSTVGDVVDQLLKDHDRRTGTFSVTLGLPKPSLEEKRTTERSEGTINIIENKAHESFRRHCL